jgi:D-glycerate 3-kinase
LRRAERLPADYDLAARPVIGPLADRLAAMAGEQAASVIVGICGAQGSGKSTLALFLGNWLEREIGLSVARLSLDDLYLTKAQRLALAASRHPLLRTRGVPGTHDIDLGLRILDDLTTGTGRVALPAFDKKTDDRAPVSAWSSAEAPVDVVLFEGWCVGARPQPESALGEPVNELEADEDPDARWRGQVNERLATDYAAAFARLDALVLLRVPSFDRVLDWRGLQERKLTGSVDSRRMLRFIQHFERLTRHILDTMPAYADAIIDVDDRHRMAAPRFQGRLAR